MTKILLVDDHPAICFALKVLLEKNPDFIVTTSSGENLLALLHREQPSLLILDLELKTPTGWIFFRVSSTTSLRSGCWCIPTSLRGSTHCVR
ncbi:response regulator [Enterobacter cloacae]|uniref:response regulator n=1 Tax=Enterobacter cloacae TaxID=550 RepID=UPI00300EF8CB